jgi:uncharacterized protein YuzE
MKLTYDPQHNIGYIRFRKKTSGVETLRVSAELNIDIAPNGLVYGIELLNANEQLSSTPLKDLIVENASTGQSTVIALG